MRDNRLDRLLVRLGGCDAALPPAVRLHIGTLGQIVGIPTQCLGDDSLREDRIYIILDGMVWSAWI